MRSPQRSTPHRKPVRRWSVTTRGIDGGGSAATYCGMPPFTVWGTPRNPGSHAKDINRFVASHLHGKELRL